MFKKENEGGGGHPPFQIVIEAEYDVKNIRNSF